MAHSHSQQGQGPAHDSGSRGGSAVRYSHYPYSLSRSTTPLNQQIAPFGDRPPPPSSGGGGERENSSRGGGGGGGGRASAHHFFNSVKLSPSSVSGATQQRHHAAHPTPTHQHSQQHGYGASSAVGQQQQRYQQQQQNGYPPRHGHGHHPYAMSTTNTPQLGAASAAELDMDITAELGMGMGGAGAPPPQHGQRHPHHEAAMVGGPNRRGGMGGVVMSVGAFNNSISNTANTNAAAGERGGGRQSAMGSRAGTADDCAAAEGAAHPPLGGGGRGWAARSPSGAPPTDGSFAGVPTHFHRNSNATPHGQIPATPHRQSSSSLLPPLTPVGASGRAPAAPHQQQHHGQQPRGESAARSDSNAFIISLSNANASSSRVPSAVPHSYYSHSHSQRGDVFHRDGSPSPHGTPHHHRPPFAAGGPSVRVPPMLHISSHQQHGHHNGLHGGASRGQTPTDHNNNSINNFNTLHDDGFAPVPKPFSPKQHQQQQQGGGASSFRAPNSHGYAPAVSNRRDTSPAHFSSSGARTPVDRAQGASGWFSAGPATPHGHSGPAGTPGVNGGLYPSDPSDPPSPANVGGVGPTAAPRAATAPPMAEDDEEAPAQHWGAPAYRRGDGSSPPAAPHDCGRPPFHQPPSPSSPSPSPTTLTANAMAVAMSAVTMALGPTPTKDVHRGGRHSHSHSNSYGGAHASSSRCETPQLPHSPNGHFPQQQQHRGHSHGGFHYADPTAMRGRAYNAYPSDNSYGHGCQQQQHSQHAPTAAASPYASPMSRRNGSESTAGLSSAAAFSPPSAVRSPQQRHPSHHSHHLLPAQVVTSVGDHEGVAINTFDGSSRGASTAWPAKASTAEATAAVVGAPRTTKGAAKAKAERRANPAAATDGIADAISGSLRRTTAGCGPTPPPSSSAATASSPHSPTTAAADDGLPVPAAAAAAVYVETPESLAKRVEQREKQVKIGKSTEGYARYLAAVPIADREEGNPRHPQTPRTDGASAKRAFDRTVRDWRRALHFYDPEGEDGEGEGEGTADAAGVEGVAV